MLLPCAKPQTVVGVVYSTETLAAALALSAPPSPPDLIELRVDAFADAPDLLDALIAQSPRPLLVTVRRPAEGGLSAGLDDRRRAELFRRFLPVAAAIDLEVQSLLTLEEIASKARTKEILVVASFHDFRGTPPLPVLVEAAKKAADAGADVFKAATTLEKATDLGTLLALMHEDLGIPKALMGMGRFGRASRPVLAAAGSVLNYGYLGKAAQVPGQWSVADLRVRIDELT